MNIAGVTSTDTTNTTSPAKKTLDSNTFLQLLIAELAGQNPTDPVNDKDMFQQMATMTQVESISEMKTTAQFTQAQGLMSHEIQYSDSAGKMQTGVVDKVTFTSGQAALDVAGTSVTLDQVQADLGIPK